MISISIHHPTLPPGPIQGFRFFWAFYVNGINPNVHCQPCFRGKRSHKLQTASVHSGREYLMDESRNAPYLYLCGVGSGPRNLLYTKNFHLALQPRDGASESRTTYNGYTVHAANAEALPIPEIPDGWNGLPLEHTRCRNFRFAVARFGSH
jgi:hypothetical protein